MHQSCFKEKKHLSISSGFKAPRGRTVHHFKAQRLNPFIKKFQPKNPKPPELVGCTTCTLKQSPREIDGLKNWMGKEGVPVLGVKRPIFRNKALSFKETFSENLPKNITLQESNISHQGKSKVIFKYALSGGYVNSLEGISLWKIV